MKNLYKYLIILSLLLQACTMPPRKIIIINSITIPSSDSIWKVQIGNQYGHEIYYCNRYRQDQSGNTYYLFDSKDNNIKSITISAGYYIETDLNK